MDPIRIFVGCAANNEDLESQAVLEYTLRKFVSKPLEIEWMQQSNDPTSFWSGWNTNGWVTPFSGFRWGIPARCNFEGKAIYMDSDMIVRDDIAKLWDMPMNPGAACISKGHGKRFCVTLFDNAKIKPFMLPIQEIKTKMGVYRIQRDRISQQKGLVQSFPKGQNWNCCDGETYKDLGHSDIKCIHYTAIDTQPQLRYAIPRLASAGVKHWYKGKPRAHSRKDLLALFDKLLTEAKAAGYPPERYIVQGIGGYKAGSDGGGWIKPGKAQEAARHGGVAR